MQTTLMTIIATVSCLHEIGRGLTFKNILHVNARAIKPMSVKVTTIRLTRIDAISQIKPTRPCAQMIITSETKREDKRFLHGRIRATQYNAAIKVATNAIDKNISKPIPALRDYTEYTYCKLMFSLKSFGIVSVHFKDMRHLLFVSPRHAVSTLAASFVFAIFTTFGLSLKWFGGTQFTNPAVWALFLLAIIGFYLILSALSRFLVSYSLRLHDHIRSFAPWAITAVVALIVCWGAVFLASFPGYYAYDTRFFNWYLEDGTIDSIYSVLYVLFVANIMRIGMMLFGSFDSGVAFYIVLQLMLLIGFVLYVLHSFYRSGCTRWMMVVFIAFYALDPIVAMLANCTTRDTLFSAFFVLLSMDIMAFIRSKERPEEPVIKAPKHGKSRSLRVSVNGRFGNAVQIVSIVLLMSLCTCYRSHCLYVFVLFGIIVAFFAISKHSRFTMIVIISSILSSTVLYAIWSGAIVASLNNVEHESSYGSTLCVVNMQMAYACADENIDVVNKLEDLGIDRELLADCSKSSPTNSDTAGFIVSKALKTPESEREYISIWAETVTRYPQIAIDAFLQLTKGAWSPFESINAYSYKEAYSYNQTKTSLFVCAEEPPVVMQSKIPWLQDFLWEVSRYDLLGGNPLTAWSVSTPFFLWLYIFTFMRAIQTRNRALSVACVLFACYILSLLIGPVVMTRYYLPLYLAAPLFVYCIFEGPKDWSASPSAKDQGLTGHVPQSRA